MSRRPFYRCNGLALHQRTPAFFGLEFQAPGLLLCTFAEYIPMCYRAWLSCGASSRPDQEGGMQVRYRASLATISALVVASLAVLAANSCTPFGLTCISNRKWLAGLETPVTRTKQTSEVVSNRDTSPRFLLKTSSLSTAFRTLVTAASPTFKWNFPAPRGEYVTTRATGRPTF